VKPSIKLSIKLLVQNSQTMKSRIMYLELKNGSGHSGPAWIGFVEFSKSGKTIYFDDKALKKLKIPGLSANHFDIENGEEYWVSGIKKNGGDRHQFGGGKIMIDKNSIEEYLNLVDFEIIDSKNFDIVEFKKTDKDRFNEIENSEMNYESGDNIQARYWDNNKKKLS
jgi:hypothetical protein